VVLGAVAFVIWGSFVLLRDPVGPDRLVAWLLRLFGQRGSADAVLRDGLTPVTSKLITAAVALTVGVGGIWMLFLSANRVVDRMGRWRDRVRPVLFVGPALAMVTVFLIYPTVSTIVTSLREGEGGVANYRRALTDPDMLVAFRNNVVWLVVATGGSVLIGLVIAALVDRVKREALAKTFIFLPLAISMVGASVTWRFVYAWQPQGETQIGVLNAVVTALGGQARPWIQTPPLNTLALIVIMVWLQTGFAMVVLSAALKAVPTELIEAAKIDGATELQLFFRIVLPMIRRTILTVATVICIAVLKVFDIVFVMTGGDYKTDVVANRMFTEMFKFRNFGVASSIAVLLFVMVVPFMVLNIRNLKRQGFA
jgi:alpha-glucoside transport system permease protein